jgi:hypothetical protein
MASYIGRRKFLATLGGAAAVSWPLAAHAQQPERVGRIGVLMAYAQNDREYQSYLAAFREELQKLGWTEGRNVQIDYRWAALDPDVAKITFCSATNTTIAKPKLLDIACRSSFHVRSPKLTCLWKP